MLIGALVTFLVVILILYLINLLPIDGRAKQICRVVVIILGVISLLKYIAVFLGRWSQRKAPALAGAFAMRQRASSVSLQRREPIVHVLSDLVLGEAVALLQLAFELLAAALDHIQVVVGELPPFLLRGALELLPVTFDPVPIHRRLPLS